MFSNYSSDDDIHDSDSTAPDREISVGTTSIVGIFFVLALVCAAFFGIGYTLGRRESPQPLTSPQAAAVTTSSTPKPSPGSPAESAAASADTDSPSSDSKPKNESAAIAVPPLPTTPALLPSKPVEVDETPTPHAVRATSAPVAAASASPIIVQIAAVSHHEDADVLISALTRRGYSVAIRQEPQDKLFHVQIGPFVNRKDADAMRQRLLADGYNAIVK
jgi:DedD protein